MMAELRAVGAVTGLLKSAELLLVSVQLAVLIIDLASGSRPPAVLVENAAAPMPSKQLGVFAPLPYATKSTILLPPGLVGDAASSPGQLAAATGAVPSTSAILPPV